MFQLQWKLEIVSIILTANEGKENRKIQSLRCINKRPMSDKHIPFRIVLDYLLILYWEDGERDVSFLLRFNVL